MKDNVAIKEPESKVELKEGLKRLDLKTRHLFDMVVHLNTPVVVGETPKGNRQILLGEGGEFKGDRLEGVILPHGADWFLIRKDGVGELDVRVVLQTKDGSLIYMNSTGFLHYPKEKARCVLSGSASPEEYYLREKTVFETSADNYQWLNSIVVVGTGWYQPGAVGMSLYEIQ